mgnify:FL=1
MSSTNIPSEKELEQIQPKRDKTVDRESDEGYILTIHIVSGNAVNKTKGRTYTRTYGHYFIESESKPVNSLDEFISSYVESEKVLTSFNRTRLDAYEVLVEVNDVRATNIEFNGTNEVKIKIPSHSEYTSQLDSMLSEVKNELQTTEQK